ncbi:hypothetical protein [Noviluteimonas gilva]|uniref:CopL family metal-binding regulatory protein n=1 Tax=Noviluteimonas gilva TaxID=2682097 RepID=A0A7C9HR21_9GAMM|nr:hypothetical protein [Lysobacter gilvus]MUV13371.1 hypothetical protein [Lysobacter gilvus]
MHLRLLKFHNVPSGVYGARMSARTFPPMLARLRASAGLGVLVLLVFVMKIDMATACQANDARQALGGDAPVAFVDAAAAYDKGCCLLSGCGDCCAHTLALVPQSRVLPPLVATAALPQWAIGWAPTTYPVAMRPPIAV